jgi:hypothetical protein
MGVISLGDQFTPFLLSISALALRTVPSPGAFSFNFSSPVILSTVITGWLHKLCYLISKDYLL